MVGIVVVSHSYKLAVGVLDLVEQMTQGQVPIAAAGGIDDPDNPIGTDTFMVQAAIESVYSDEGVVVLMDLGSAVLSAETAKEFLPPIQQSNVYLCEAPLVEGTISAAIQALVTTDVEQILSEARTCLSHKTNQLHLSGNVPPVQTEVKSSPTCPTEPSGMLECRLVIHNHQGLHARPAARLVKVAAQFEANISIGVSGDNASQVSAKSINQVMMLAVKSGQSVVIKATGSDSFEAIIALQRLVADRFGEPDQPPTVPPPDSPAVPDPDPTTNPWSGISVCAGMVMGRAKRYQQGLIDLPDRQAESPTQEQVRLQRAITAVHDELTAIRQQYQYRSEQESAIFEAHQLLLTDPTLHKQLEHRIDHDGLTAEAAWKACLNELIEQYRALSDPYMQTKAVDWLDIGQRVLRVLTGHRAIRFELDEPAILITSDLTPSEAVSLDPSSVIGLCTEAGSATSHTAIILRGLGIPTLVGLGQPLAGVAEDTLLLLNGNTGNLWVEPSARQQASWQVEYDQWLAAQRLFEQQRQQPARTKDQQPLTLLTNIATIADLSVALTQGAQGVGLLRTELLYSQQHNPPSEMEQAAYYQALAEKIEDGPLTIRTLDAGGDKPLPYLNHALEANPFLGRRGIRACLAQPEILQTQLRAILRVSVGHQFKILLPMISCLTEVRAVKQILQTVQTDLRQEGVPFEEKIPLGIMIELPSAVIMADLLAQEVDFFSLGTNDLAQYSMAADRTNPEVAGLADFFHPALLRLIRQTVQAAERANIGLSICGEMASDPLAAPLLLGLGLTEFSLNGPAIPHIKQALARVTIGQAKQMAQTALGLESAEAVRRYLKVT
ncbi:phosphoenolpyruvate--protein phosphotransferase [Anaerolineales bacterium HSG25]|nr:phosphoenolpyruvate--protein phosphotransferase [Anaerolineales bacterium HSG25]